jgi:two-component system response regulator MprA
VSARPGQARLLVVEDDPHLRAMLERMLRGEDFAVASTASGEAALAVLAAEPIDGVVLDVGLPGASGLDVVRELRAAGSTVAVLMLTARDAIDDRVAGLDAGADDYLVKPFHMRELLARVRTMLRRVDSGKTRLTMGDLELDLDTREARRGERSFDLSRTEFALLRQFMLRPGEVLTTSVIYRAVWGYDFGATSNTLRVYVGYLRRKLEAGGEPRLLLTVQGIGYVLREPRT